MRTIAALLLLTTVAFAADEPKKFTVDMTARVLDFRSKPIKDLFEATREDIACDKCSDLTLGAAIWNAVNKVIIDSSGRQEDISPRDRNAWVYLVAKIKDDPEASLSAKERTALIDRVTKVYSNIQPVVSARAPMMLDPNWKIPEVDDAK